MSRSLGASAYRPMSDATASGWRFSSRLDAAMCARRYAPARGSGFALGHVAPASRSKLIAALRKLAMA